MKEEVLYDVVIVGGGLAGLVSSIELARQNLRVLLLEKKEYPFHRVCGEYVSNEVLAYLQKLGMDPFRFGASTINRLRISSPAGKNFFILLDMGGFGLSRYTMDYELYRLALESGACILTSTRVWDIDFNGPDFTVKTGSGTYYAKMVIAAHGKRDGIDKKFQRPFMEKRTGYMGVKYHLRLDYPPDEIGLDNFRNGYSGISQVEGNTCNLCYLSYRGPNKAYRNIKEMEEGVLFKNPVLRSIFERAEFLWKEPLVISQLNFCRKSQVDNHVFFCGDSAGLITPLCGNGMSMAIGSARLLTELIKESGYAGKREISLAERNRLENAYIKEWKELYRKRLFWGRTIQRFFGEPHLTSGFLNTLHCFPRLERKLVSLTHGPAI